MLRPLLLTIFINCFLFTHTQSQIDGKLDQNITSKFNSNKSFNTIKKTEVFNGSNEIIDAITQHGITCLKPTGLSTSDHNQNSVTLNWLPVTGAQSYEITVVQSITNATSYTYYSNTHNYILSGVAANGHYFWSVRAICNPGDTSELANSEFHNASPAANFITNDCSGRFTDSGGEFGNYNQNENYTFTISPVNAATVSLTFTDFDLETNFDYIRIFDGVGTNAPTLGTYTGNTTPPVITSTGSSLTIQFISNASNQSSGWIASWTCSSTSPSTILTNPILLNNNSVGFLDCNRSYHDFYDSGNSTGAYGNNENYTRTFCNTDPTKAVRLSFRPNPTAAQQLSISSTTTSNDYLYFYNGADTTANLIGVYTGASTSASQPGTFISSGACLTVKFNSDASFVGSGWKARLYCSDPPTNLGSVEVGGTEGTKVFTDIGGISSNYNNNENYVVTYCPHTSAPIDDVVWAEFTSTVGLERSWDYLYVFDGLDTDNSRLICAYTGDATNTNTLETIKASIMNPSGCLTFQFFSDESTTASGWEANISTGEARLAYASETCNTATFVNKTGSDYAGSTTLATGTPGTDDPSLNISLPSLPECSGSNEITRLENTVWYRFITPDTICIPTSMHIRLKNISCQGKGAGGSGLQFVLYEINQCAAGTVWPTPVYCSDKLNSGDSVDVASLLLSNQSYYLMVLKTFQKVC